MSFRVELLRFSLRHFWKDRDGARPDVPAIRRSLDRTARYMRVPKRVEVSAVDAGGVPALRFVTPRSRRDRHLLYLHGGGYCYGTPSLYRDLVWRLADEAEAVALCIDYRLAPEHPFPAAVDDAALAYRWMLANGALPGRTAILGDSAGGGLTFGTLLRLRDDDVPMPAAAAGLSPWADMTLSGTTIRTNAKADPMLNATQARYLAEWYVGAGDPKNPYVSPIFGDAAGLPPSLIQVGDDEIVRDDAERLAARLRAAGCTTELEVWPRMPHVWHMHARYLPEARQAIAGIGSFIKRHMTSD